MTDPLRRGPATPHIVTVLRATDMSKFVYVFTGGTMAATPEEQQTVM